MKESLKTEKQKEKDQKYFQMEIDTLVNGKMIYSMEVEYTLISKIKQKDKENGKMVKDIAGQHLLNRLIFQEKEKQVLKILHLLKAKVKLEINDKMKNKYYKKLSKYKLLL